MSTKKINIAINGFGRIGRATFKIITDRYSDFNVVAINDLTDTKTLAHLLKYDSCYGIYPRSISFDEKNLIVDKKKVPVFAEKEPQKLPWGKLKVDVVLECTGRFRDEKTAGLHIEAGAKKVIISAPAEGKVKTIVLGVNEDKVTKKDLVISCASCTTNCLAPVSEVIRKAFGIKKALMTTVHSYTADQNLVDGPHKDLRRARAAAINMVPTKTGAAVAAAETIPSLKGKFDGMAVRVPTPTGSLCDVVYLTTKKVTPEKVNDTFRKAAATLRFKGIIEASDEALVSTDIVGNPHSAIVDLKSTKVVGGDLLKVVAWYDNEWGYSNRFADLAAYLKKKNLV